MDSLQAVSRPSKWVSDDHLVVLLNGVLLDELLAHVTSDEGHSGLITTLDKALSRNEDRELAWARINPPFGHRSIAPVLVCPDDLDYSCSVIVAEVSRGEDVTEWARVGVYTGESTVPSGDPSDVRWLDGLGPYRFVSADYDAFLDDCRALASEWWA